MIASLIKNMSLKILEELVYKKFPSEMKKNPGPFLRGKQLNILECPETDLEYSDDEIIVEQPIEKVDTSLKKVTIFNDTFNESAEFLLDDNGNLLTRTGMICGMYRNWIDDNIPSRYCDEKGNVLCPETGEPIYEYKILDPKNILFDDQFPNKIYRSYRYDRYFDRFIKLDAVKN